MRHRLAGLRCLAREAIACGRDRLRAKGGVSVLKRYPGFSVYLDIPIHRPYFEVILRSIKDV